jgi:hypothetical protein
MDEKEQLLEYATVDTCAPMGRAGILGALLGATLNAGH